METLTFGTDGIRGRVGEFPFTPHALKRVSCALARWMVGLYGNNGRRVKILLAGDTRESVEDIKKIFVEVATYFPLDIVDAGVIPTPAVLTLIRNDASFHCGVMISASHNPYHDNGIKVFDALSGKITIDDEVTISALFGACGDGEPCGVVTDDKVGSVQAWPDAASNYAAHLRVISSPSKRVRRNIVLDCAHGATFQVAQRLFEALGYEVIALHTKPDGKNINNKSGALHPEVLRDAVVAAKADIGFAFDGDGDRIVAVSRDGVVKDGDDIIAALLDLEEYAQEACVVTTVMSNAGFEAYLKQRNKALVRTAVGDKHVVKKLEELDLQVGGETSGHIILKNYLPSGDGLLVAIKLLEVLENSGRWALDHVKKFPQRTINVVVKEKRDLKLEPYAGIIKEYDEMLGNGRTLVRYSGTEPLLRIMIEGEDAAQVETIGQQLAGALQNALNAERE